MKPGVYKIISPTGKMYIGQSIDLERREKEYKQIECKKQPKVFYSIKKYGWEKHKFEIIEECKLDQLDERETFYKQQIINKFGWKNALFCHIVDGKGGIKSLETRQKMSKANKGIPRPMTEESKLKRKKTIEEKGGRWWGHKLGGKGVPRIKLKKPINQFNLDGILIKTWESISEAELYFSGDRNKDNIGACCRGKQKTAYGYVWQYL